MRRKRSKGESADELERLNKRMDAFEEMIKIPEQRAGEIEEISFMIAEIHEDYGEEFKVAALAFLDTIRPIIREERQKAEESSQKYWDDYLPADGTFVAAGDTFIDEEEE